ncbi:MFS transporter [Clostridium lundense]|uniref:MFS transporter n=1 Tax=Clostridium lundense TaxID=319475 RepID=UPI0006877021|nr:MFS transporter [Clostridium lundense]
MNNYRKNLYIMCIVAFLQGLVFYGPIATIFRQYRGLSLYQIFLLESIFTLSMILLEIPWGYFSDKFGYKRTLILSYLLFFISKIIFYKSYDFYGFLLETIVVSMSISGISGCDSALIYLSVGEKESERAFSLYSAAGASGLFIASFLSTFMLKKSLDIPVLCTIFPYGTAFVLIFFIKDVEYDKKNISIKNSFKNVVQNKKKFIFIIAIALTSEITHSICVFLNGPKYLNIGIDVRYFGLLTAFMQIICLASAKSYKLSKNFGHRIVFNSLISIITIASFLLAYSKSAIITIILIAFIEGAFALVQPLSLDIQNKSIKTADRATMLSIYAMISDVIASAVNIAIGKSADISLGFSFVICGILSLVALIFIIIYFNYVEEKSSLKFKFMEKLLINK